MSTIFFLQIGFLATVLFQITDKEPLLDLSQFQIKGDVLGGWVDGGGVITEGPQPSPAVPLRIEILRFDKARYEPGDEFVYEVRVRNIGKEEAVIPWDPDHTHFPFRLGASPPAGYKTAFLKIRVKGHPELREVSTHQIYGSTGVGSSLLSLRPGQTARIRGKGKWDFEGIRGEKGEWNAATPITVEALLDFTAGSPTNDLTALRSFESEPVQVDVGPLRGVRASQLTSGDCEL